MTYEDYCIQFTENTSNHEAIIIGTTVSCNYMHCNYEEAFPNVADAETAATIHEGV